MLRPKIAIIDDEVDMTYLLSIELDMEGYDVCVANDGISGWNLIQVENPAVVLLDVMMPGIDGYEVLRRVRADPTLCGIKVIMLTARSFEADIKKGFEAGADDYLPKPFQPMTLLKKIRDLVQKSSAMPAGG